MSAGSWLRAALMAACTSRAAALMSGLRSNWRVMFVLPRPLVEVIWVTPAMRPNWRSRGVATAEAMVSGLAPGNPDPTEIVGKSTCGSGATGKKRNATTPERRMAKVISEVATGRRMKGAEKLEEKCSMLVSGRRLLNRTAKVNVETTAEPVESQIDHRRGIERQQLAKDQSADNGDTEGAAQLRADASPDGQRQAAEERGHSGHHDRAEAQQAGFVDSVERQLPFFALGFQREVNHHDGVFLDDADEQDDANQCDDAEFRVVKQQGENRPDAG